MVIFEQLIGTVITSGGTDPRLFVLQAVVLVVRQAGFFLVIPL